MVTLRESYVADDDDVYILGPKGKVAGRYRHNYFNCVMDLDVSQNPLGDFLPKISTYPQGCGLKSCNSKVEVNK